MSHFRVSVGQGGRAKTCQGAREKLPQKGKRITSILKNPTKDADLGLHLLIVLEGNAAPPAHFGKSWIREKIPVEKMQPSVCLVGWFCLQNFSQFDIQMSIDLTVHNLQLLFTGCFGSSVVAQFFMFFT